MGKNVARTHWSASALSTAGVLPGHGPSSNVNTTSPLRRKSCILKCSQPKPGPPVVSISTTRETRIAFGFAHDDAGAAAGGGAAANVAGAGAAGAAPAAGALVCAHATVNAPTETDTTIAHALATRIACSLAVTVHHPKFCKPSLKAKAAGSQSKVCTKQEKTRRVLVSWLRSQMRQTWLNALIVDTIVARDQRTEKRHNGRRE